MVEIRNTNSKSAMLPFIIRFVFIVPQTMTAVNGRQWRDCDFSRLKIGCQRPDVEIPEAVDKELLCQLQHNDPEIEGLRIGYEDWIEGIGRTVGDSEYLRKIKIYVYDQPWPSNPWLDDLWYGLSQNRSIEWFSLNLHESELDLRIDEVLTSFIKFNFQSA